MTIPDWNLTELGDSTSQIAHVIVNTMGRVLAAHIPHVLQDLTLTAPPGSPAESAVWWVAATATGAWAGQDGDLATYIAGNWHFRTPMTGERWYDADTAAEYLFNGATWDAA